MLFVPYNKEKVEKELENVSIQLKETEDLYDNLTEETEFDEEIEQERVYVLRQLYIRENKLKKNRNKSIVLFNICGFALVIIGFIALF